MSLVAGLILGLGFAGLVILGLGLALRNARRQTATAHTMLVGEAAREAATALLATMGPILVARAEQAMGDVASAAAQRTLDAMAPHVQARVSAAVLTVEEYHHRLATRLAVQEAATEIRAHTAERHAIASAHALDAALSVRRELADLLDAVGLAILPSVASAMSAPPAPESGPQPVDFWTQVDRTHGRRLADLNGQAHNDMGGASP